MTGVDLTRIDGVDGFTALKVLSEIGTDMTKWPSAGHFASWLGLSPDNRVTGGKVISPKTKPSASRRRRLCVWPPTRCIAPSAPWVPFCAGRRPSWEYLRAITATVHKLARIIYAMLRYGQAYADAGAGYYESQYRQRALRATKRRAAQLGYQLVPESDAQAPVMPHASTAAVA